MKTILSVDDKKFSHVILHDIIEHIGKMMNNTIKIRFLTAYSGKEGIEKAIKEQPVIILMDINMPDMDGLETTKKLREINETKNTPIIAVTAQAMSGDRENCLRAGCNEFFSKPYDISKLSKCIISILEERK
ncbi:MAG: response regulator [Spirochaetota bacterium]|nr:response regulator [Spirochaetota bacterium]